MVTSSPCPFGQEIARYIEKLALFSESKDQLTRVFLSPEHRQAAELLIAWMRDAGMSTAMDPIGNVVGRYEGQDRDAPTLLLGSHFDTVRNAGKWDGPLGVATAIACVSHLNRQNTRLPYAIEVVAFADEEGTRFSSTLLGSRAFAGRWDRAVLSKPDRSGVRMSDAMHAFGLDPDQIETAARPSSRYTAFLELHIEQGPVLEMANLPLGVVTGISGATRLQVGLSGSAGHAGTVPMTLRRDALAGAAECVVMVEALCTNDEALFGTVGQIEVRPGATNVIPGLATFSVDVRSASNDKRKKAVGDIKERIQEIAARRRLVASIETTHEQNTVPCALQLQRQIAMAIERAGYRPLALPSGAGHDAMALADLTNVGMIFVRCRGGVSHHPDEHVSVEDADIGARVLLDVIEHFQPCH
jgi:allantoate deiminase